MLRRTLEGASKCALRDLRREEWRSARGPLLVLHSCQWKLYQADVCVANVLELTLAILMEFCRRIGGDLVDWSLPERGMGEGVVRVVEILSFASGLGTHTLAPPCCSCSRLWIGAFGAVFPWRTDFSLLKAVGNRTRTRQKIFPQGI